MTTNDNSTNDAIDAGEVLDSLRIAPATRSPMGGAGRWVCGTIAGHRFEAKVYPEHAEVPEYELNDSRISKLWIKRLSDNTTVVNFDRGWDMQPGTPLARLIVDLLSEGLADLIYAD